MCFSVKGVDMTASKTDHIMQSLSILACLAFTDARFSLRPSLVKVDEDLVLEAGASVHPDASFGVPASDSVPRLRLGKSQGSKSSKMVARWKGRFGNEAKRGSRRIEGAAIDMMVVYNQGPRLVPNKGKRKRGKSDSVLLYE